MLNANKPYIVYMHTCPNGKVYIGITCETLAQRCKRGKGYRPNQAFWKAIQKYGWDGIKHEILYSDLTKEQAEQKEVELIAEHKSNQKEHGYNIAMGGGVNCGFHLSQQTKDKISKANSGKNNGMYGKRFSFTPEQYEKVVNNARLRNYSDGNNPKAKKVYQFSEHGELIKVWDCIKHASEFLSVSHSYLIRVMNEKKIYKNCYWAYESEVVKSHGNE